MKINIDTEKLVQNSIDWLGSSGLMILIVLIVAEIANHFAKMIISRAVNRLLSSRSYATEKDRKQRAKTLTRMFSTSARIIIWVFAVVFILIQLGVDIAAIVAGAGFFGLAFGIGAQSIIQDILSGIFIIVENQYRVGDIVELNGNSGEVVDITMRITQLRDIDGNAHFIPNGEIKHSINKSFGYSKINMSVNVAYEMDIDKVEKVINQTGQELAKNPEFGKYIEEVPSFARIDNFGDSGVEIKIFGMVSPGKQWKIAGEFRRMLKKNFEKNKIVIPFQQVDIHNRKG